MAGAVIQPSESMARIERHVRLNKGDDPRVVTGNAAFHTGLSADSYRAQPPGLERPSRDAVGSELSVNNVLEHVVHQRQVGIHGLELGIIVLQLAKLR